MAKKKPAKRGAKKRAAQPTTTPFSDELLTQLEELNRGLSSLVEAVNVDGIESHLETISEQLGELVEALQRIPGKSALENGSHEAAD
jgi:hypothetical protein